MFRMPTTALAPRLLKAEALLRPEYEGPHEMWDGVLVKREWSPFDTSAISASAMSLLFEHVTRRKLGRVTGSRVGYVLARGPDRVLVADAAFISVERTRIIVPGKFVEGAPDLAVEVRSPPESWISVVQRIGIWLAHGVRLVWAIDPEQRVVVVSRGFDPPETLTGKDTLDGAPVLPKFRIKVSRLFAGL